MTQTTSLKISSKTTLRERLKESKEPTLPKEIDLIFEKIKYILNSFYLKFVVDSIYEKFESNFYYKHKDWFVVV